MATFTASILVGHAHPNDSGISPTHQLFLSENSRPAWILHSFSPPRKIAVWIPTVEDMLQDGLLMVGLLVVKHPPLVAASGVFNADPNRRVELYENIDEASRKKLYIECRSIGPEVKAVITVLRGSTIERQLPVLADYELSLEICPSTYFREYSMWSQKVIAEGSIPFGAQAKDVIIQGDLFSK